MRLMDLFTNYVTFSSEIPESLKSFCLFSSEIFLPFVGGMPGYTLHDVTVGPAGCLDCLQTNSCKIFESGDRFPQ